MFTSKALRRGAAAASITLIAGGALAGVGHAAPAAKASAPKAAAAKAAVAPTGRITYKVSSKFMEGSTTLAWTDYGKKFRQEMNATGRGNGKTLPLSNWVISDGKNVYMHSPMMGQQVTRMKITPDMLKGFGKGMPMITAPKDLGKSLGTATVAGRACSIHNMPQAGNTKIWVWQNLPLKMEMGAAQAGGMTMEATKVETGIKLASSLFQVPAGMPVKDFQPPKGGFRKP